MEKVEGWNVVGSKVCSTLNSLYLVHAFCLVQVGRIKVWSRRRKFSTCVHLAFRLATHLRWLALTYTYFGRAQIQYTGPRKSFTVWPPTCVDLRWLTLTLVELKFNTQVHASLSPFGHPRASTCVDFGRAQVCTQIDARFHHLTTVLLSTQVDRKSGVVLDSTSMSEMYGSLRLAL